MIRHTITAPKLPVWPLNVEMTLAFYSNKTETAEPGLLLVCRKITIDTTDFGQNEVCFEHKHCAQWVLTFPHLLSIFIDSFFLLNPNVVLTSKYIKTNMKYDLSKAHPLMKCAKQYSNVTVDYSEITTIHLCNV